MGTSILMFRPYTARILNPLPRLKPQLHTVHTRHFSSSIRAMAAQEYKLKGVTSLSLNEGDKQEVEVEGVEGGKVLLVNAAGTIQAVGSKCTHYGAPLMKGVMSKAGRLTCPWHGACFNAKTGDVEDAPALDSLPVFKTIERDGAVYITGEESAIKSSKRKPNFKCNAAGGAQEEKVVVVGGGSGALGVMEALRKKGYGGPLTVVSKEGYLPIDRPKLSKALMSDTDKLAWRDKSWFELGSVEWVDAEVEDVDFSERCVVTKDKKKFAYTKLVLATGGEPKLLPLQGFKVLDNIFTLRNAHDTKKITDAIGEKGKKIEGKGVKFYMGASVDKAEPSNDDPSKVGSVHLKDGTKLDADLVILGVGVSPATEFLKNNKILRLEQDGSIKTDENFSVVGLKDVYAIGDISTYPYHGPGGDGKPTRIEHWNVAQNAGRAVADNIVNPSYTGEQFIPVFWSALGSQMRYCGNTIMGWDDVIVDGNPAEAKFVAYYTKGDTVVAMASMGRDPLMVQSATLMRTKK